MGGCAPRTREDTVRPRACQARPGRRLRPGRHAVPNSKSYWFPAKAYGWGWGTPTTWQGWVVLLLWFAALFEGLYLLRHNRYQVAARLAFVVVMSIALMLLCYWNGEPPKWRWGDQSR